MLAVFSAFVAGVVLTVATLVVLPYLTNRSLWRPVVTVRVQSDHWYDDLNGSNDWELSSVPLSDESIEYEISAWEPLHVLDGNTEEDRRILVHEAGHALIALRDQPDSIQYLIGTPHFNSQTGKFGPGFYARSRVKDPAYDGRLNYGGYAAERVVLGHGSMQGAEQDISHAIQNASRLTRTKPTDDDSSIWSAIGLGDPRDRDEVAVAAVIDQCQAFLDRATAIIQEERPTLDAIVSELGRKQILSRRELLEIWQRFHPTSLA